MPENKIEAGSLVSWVCRPYRSGVLNRNRPIAIKCYGYVDKIYTRKYRFFGRPLKIVKVAHIRDISPAEYFEHIRRKQTEVALTNLTVEVSF